MSTPKAPSRPLISYVPAFTDPCIVKGCVHEYDHEGQHEYENDPDHHDVFPGGKAGVEVSGMTLEQMLEELNESDAACCLRDLSSSFDCLGSVESTRDFRSNLLDAIDEAEELLKGLRALRAAIR